MAGSLTDAVNAALSKTAKTNGSEAPKVRSVAADSLKSASKSGQA